MDVRTPAPGRVLVVETTRALFGVLVRDAAVLDAVDPTCFVGDLVGDRVMLEGRAVRGAGLGLAALRLIRLLRPGSAALETRPVPGAKLLGRLVFLTTDCLAAGGGGGAGAAGASSTMPSVVGRTNMP